ncbi:MAG: adenylosuccinate lyase [Acidobacteriota bacterium]
MIDRYSRPQMAGLFTDEARFRRWLDVEIAVCEVLARRGLVPADALATIKDRAGFDVDRIAAIEATTHHDVIAFLTAVGEKVGPAARYIHFGLTSSDVIDTALSLTLFEAADLLRKDLEMLSATLRRQALAHRRTAMVGRTHGIHALPTTLGLKFLLWYSDTRRSIEHLGRASETLRVGKVSGAVGTYAALDPDVEEEVCHLLGLRPAPVSTQVLQRDRHAAYVSALALIAANLEKIATEIRGLQRTDIREVEEPFASGQKGSSVMPHKRNPVACENVSGLARVVRSNALAALENIALWHERDISHSSVERVILPDSSILVDYMIHRMNGVLSGLLVYPERMRENLGRMRGLVFSAEVLLALVRAGATRDEAYGIVQRNAMRVWDGDHTLKDLLMADEAVTARVSIEEIEQVFDLDHQLRNVDSIYARVLGDEPEVA